MTNIIRQAHPLHDLAFQGERTGKLHSLFLLVAGLGGLLDGIDVGMIALALLPAICHACESRIEDAGGIDLQILCIGTDGHTGFYEPTFLTASRTGIRTLMRRTREDKARFFGFVEDLSRHVITMGIVTLMEARQCLLRDFGESGMR